MNTITIATGYVLSIITCPSDSMDLCMVETPHVEVPAIAMDTCIRDNHLDLLTGVSRSIDPSGGRSIRLCTPVLEQREVP